MVGSGLGKSDFPEHYVSVLVIHCGFRQADSIFFLCRHPKLELSGFQISSGKALGRFQRNLDSLKCTVDVFKAYRCLVSVRHFCGSCRCFFCVLSCHRHFRLPQVSFFSCSFFDYGIGSFRQVLQCHAVSVFQADHCTGFLFSGCIVLVSSRISYSKLVFPLRIEAFRRFHALLYGQLSSFYLFILNINCTVWSLNVCTS